MDASHVSRDIHLQMLLDASLALRHKEGAAPLIDWLESVSRDLNWAIGEIWSWTGRFFRLEHAWHDPLSAELAEFLTLTKQLNSPFERTTVGIACAQDEPIYLPNFPEHSGYRGPIAGQFGLQSCLAMPIRTAGETVYGLVLLDYQPRAEINPTMVALEVACDELGLYLSLQQMERRQSLAASRLALARITHDLSFDAPNRMLSGPLGTLRLSGIEWDVFNYLAQHRGSVVSHRDLMQKIWGVIDTNSRNSLYEIMSRLRSRLRRIGVDRSTLQVVPKQGYVLHFEPETELSESAGAA